MRDQSPELAKARGLARAFFLKNASYNYRVEVAGIEYTFRRDGNEPILTDSQIAASPGAPDYIPPHGA